MAPEKITIPEIRPFQLQDLEAVYKLELTAYPFPWSLGIFSECLRSGIPAWVMEEAGIITAYSLVSMGAGESHLLNLCIHPEKQGRGLGGQFLDWILNAVRERGADIMFLEVRPSNLAAIALYENRGFNQVGLRPGYYRNGNVREDAIVMARQLR